MDVYKRVLRSVIATVCACCAVAGIGLVATPGLALAKVTCGLITGSGSTLQSEQQELWIEEVKINKVISGTGATECIAAAPVIEYNLPTGIGSGQGLEEFGVNAAKALLPALSSNKTTLDAFVGSDDPPTLAQMTEMKEASESEPLVVPVVAAPVAIIVHLPAECALTGLAQVTNLHLEELFSGVKMSWSTLLGTSVSGAGCASTIMVDVRSDSSGTSFALKQYLCQVEPTVWDGGGANTCESGLGFVVDSATWPQVVEKVLTEHGTKLNEGSKGEVEAVEEEAGSIGYVNLANASKGTFKLSATGETLFWVNVEENNSSKFADPLETGEQGHCPTAFTFPTGTETEAKESMWDKIHLAKFGQENAYPICTFTYAITWEKFLTTKLELSTNYNGAVPAEELANTTRAYFEFIAKAGQGLIAVDYSKLPANVDAIAEGIAEKITP